MTVGRVLNLAAQNYINGHPEHLRRALVDTLNVMLSAADTFNTDMAIVGTDSNLSGQGRESARARIAAAALATLGAIEATTIATLTTRAAQMEAVFLATVTYMPPKDPAERIAHELRLQEIRAQLQPLSLEERTNVYRTTTDTLTIAAIDTAPMLSVTRADGSHKMEPFIEPSERIAAALARAERADPAKAATLREVRSVAEVYALAVNGLRSEILQAVPGATPQPVAV